MKRKIYFYAVWFMLMALVPPGLWPNVNTEKSTLFIGGYAEYLDTLLNQEDQSYEEQARSYRINMKFGWFIQEDFAVGLMVGYGFSREKERSTLLDYSDSISTDVFRVGLFMRNYIPLSGSLSFFIESSVVGGFGGIDGRSVSDLGESYTLSGTRFELEVGVRPGMVFFIKKGFAVEATVGFIGFTYLRERLGDGLINWKAESKNLDFSMEVNLLRIQFGLAIYF